MSNLQKADITRDESTELMLSKLTISQAQKDIASKSVYKMTNASSKMNFLEKEIRKVKNAIAEDIKTQKLKELKRQLKIFKSIHQESINSYNGILEMALADIPGKNVVEKLEKLGV